MAADTATTLHDALDAFSHARRYAAQADTDEDSARRTVSDRRDDLLIAIAERLLGVGPSAPADNEFR